jgi:hypothetical protein
MKTLLLSVLAFVSIAMTAGAATEKVPSFRDFNTNQFSTNGLKVNIKAGVRLTNAVIANATASRPLYLASDGTVTNASGTPDGTKFMRDDGVLVATGSGSVTSVGLNSIPAQFGTNSGPITGAGSLGFTNVYQAQNLFLAGPTSGAAANPGYRAIVLGDLPIGSIQDVINLTNTTTYSTNAASVNQIVKAPANVLTNLTEWQNSSGTILASVRSNGTFMAADGTAPLPSFAFVSDNTLGVFKPAVNSLGFGTVGTERMRVVGQGSGGVLFIPSPAGLGFISVGTTIGGADTHLCRDSAATLQLGADAVAPVAQTIKAHDATGTDIAGANLTLEGGQSTGNGRGGSYIVKTSLSTTNTAATTNSYSTRAYLSAKYVNLTESSATLVLNVSLATNRYCGIRLLGTTYADNGTDYQVVTETLAIAAVNKNGTVTTAVSASSPAATLTSSGTLTTAWTAVANSNGIDIKNNAVSSLTQTSLATKWRIEIDSDDTPTITPQ